MNALISELIVTHADVATVLRKLALWMEANRKTRNCANACRCRFCKAEDYIISAWECFQEAKR